MGDLSRRVLTAALLIPLALALLWVGGYWLVAGLGVVSLLCAWEYVGLIRKTPFGPGWHWILIAGALYLGFIFLPGWEPVLMGGVFGLATLEALSPWERTQSLPRASLILWGMVYTAVLPALCARLALAFPAAKPLFWLLLLIWSADTAAYFVGKAWGKRRNVVPVSPNKSTEGFAAGALVPFLIAVIFYFTGLFNDPLLLALMAFAAGVIGQLGDLAESMVKRFCEVKDSSRLIPGHGGILDRTDSVLLAGAFMYICSLILTKVR